MLQPSDFEEDHPLPGIGHNQPPEEVNTETLAWEPPDSLRILACPRVPVLKCPATIPAKYWLDIKERGNLQAINPCCYDPNELEIDAWYSSPAQAATGVPNSYKLYCSCGRTHARFMGGGGDVRPKWETR